MKRVELGTFKIDISVRNGEMQYGFPRMEFLQDNLKEALPLVPDGEYQWTLTMALNNAQRPDKTIQEYIDAGAIACPTIGCETDRPVAKDGKVQACPECKDGRNWNLFYSTH